MKIRNGFVSNSSSTSFICQECGETWSGYSGEYGDIREMSCENGHSLCSECADKHLNIEELQDIIIKELQPEDQVKYAKDPKALEKFIDEEFGGIEEFLTEFDLDWGLPEETCSICTFKTLTTYDGYRYLTYKNKMSEQDILDAIKEEFGDYKLFAKRMKELGL